MKLEKLLGSFNGTLCEHRQPSRCDETPCVHGRCILTKSLDTFRCECQIGFTECIRGHDIRSRKSENHSESIFRLLAFMHLAILVFFYVSLQSLTDK
uniref:EGF-like domain-containing protein n=1 Tax=Elaeophora elaphi TaxID=1147741 RepID=A0A0R3RHI3_9BILA